MRRRLRAASARSCGWVPMTGRSMVGAGVIISCGLRSGYGTVFFSKRTAVRTTHLTGASMATDVTQDRLAGTWNFAPVHSAATFSVKYLVAPFRGEFTDVQAQLEDGRLTGAVKVASIAVKDENLAAHLQGPDFFDAEQHPEITFSSDRIDID